MNIHELLPYASQGGFFFVGACRIGEVNFRGSKMITHPCPGPFPWVLSSFNFGTLHHFFLRLTSYANCTVFIIARRLTSELYLDPFHYLVVTTMMASHVIWSASVTTWMSRKWLLWRETTCCHGNVYISFLFTSVECRRRISFSRWNPCQPLLVRIEPTSMRDD